MCAHTCACSFECKPHVWAHTCSFECKPHEERAAAESVQPAVFSYRNVHAVLLIDMLIILPLAFVVQSRVLPIGDFFFFLTAVCWNGYVRTITVFFSDTVHLGWTRKSIHSCIPRLYGKATSTESMSRFTTFSTLLTLDLYTVMGMGYKPNWFDLLSFSSCCLLTVSCNNCDKELLVLLEFRFEFKSHFQFSPTEPRVVAFFSSSVWINFRVGSV